MSTTTTSSSSLSSPASMQPLHAGNRGLGNLGNTCYMNSAIQCLSHLLEFHPKHDSIQTLQSKGTLFDSWISLQKELWSNESDSPVIPRDFLSIFRKTCLQHSIEFYNFHQNDTEEFLNIFMDLLHRSLKQRVNITIEGDVKTNLDQLAVKSAKAWSQFFSNDYSYIIEQFYSQLVSIISCPSCDYFTVNFDPTMVISLEIPTDATSLYDCFTSYTERITLDCDNSWKCDKCEKRVQPKKKLMFWKTSPILILLLKRYTRTQKKDQFIEFPLNLDISKYSVDYYESGSNYQLSGISIQSGSLGGGHYYAMCRNSLDGQWREYNDTRVRPVDESELLQQKPYCLFYRRT